MPVAQTDEAGSEGIVDDASANPQHPFVRLLGGVRGALESILPPLVFIIVYVGLGGDSTADLTWAIVAAVGLALVFTVWRIVEGKHPARALGSMLIVLISAYIASRTGSAADFFWPRVLLNAASALAFVVANLIGWPLIGVVLGPLVGTKMSWRKDPDLMRAYKRASWPWAVLNLVRAILLAAVHRRQQPVGAGRVRCVLLRPDRRHHRHLVATDQEGPARRPPGHPPPARGQS